MTALKVLSWPIHCPVLIESEGLQIRCCIRCWACSPVSFCGRWCCVPLCHACMIESAAAATLAQQGPAAQVGAGG
jgi:hypothetical protein